MPKFPKNIFQVWFQGCKNVQRPEFVENMNAWAAINPTWTYTCVSDTELREACRQFSQECLDMYDSLPIMHMKIDLGRYVLIYLHGGIYVDMDAYAFRSLDYSKYIKNAIRIYEQENTHVLVIPKADANILESSVTGIHFSNGCMLSSPKNPLMKRFIDHVLMRCKKFAHMHGNSVVKVQKTTGPVSFSDFFNNPSILPQILVIPAVVFEPCDLNAVCRPNNETIAFHQFELSWVSSWMKGPTKFYYKYIRNSWILILMFTIVVLYTYLKVYRKR